MSLAIVPFTVGKGKSLFCGEGKVRVIKSKQQPLLGFWIVSIAYADWSKDPTLLVIKITQLGSTLAVDLIGTEQSDSMTVKCGGSRKERPRERKEEEHAELAECGGNSKGRGTGPGERKSSREGTGGNVSTGKNGETMRSKKKKKRKGKFRENGAESQKNCGGPRYARTRFFLEVEPPSFRLPSYVVSVLGVFTSSM